jgi:hypothetical protein
MAKALEGITRVVFITPFVEAHQAIATEWIQAFEGANSTLKHIVRLSIVGANNPKCLVQKWHALDDILTEDTEVPCTFVRSTLIAQSMVGLAVPIIRAANKHMFPMEHAKVAYIDARDVAAALAHAATSPVDDVKETSIDLFGTKAYTQKDIAQLVTDARANGGNSDDAKVEVTYEPVSVDELRSTLIGWGMPEILADATTELMGVVEDDNCFGEENDSLMKFMGDDYSPHTLDKLFGEVFGA